MEETVSAGICAHNEEETIGELLEQVMEEDVELDEVIVVAAGDDGTADIVREQQDRYPSIHLIREEEREGQTAAQNKIFARNSSDLLFLIDGDGLIEPGSLERMLERYDGSSILYGKEIPQTDGTFLGSLIDLLWELHHDISIEEPKFSTQLGLIPAGLVDSIPTEIVLDDEYIGVEARSQGYEPLYVPEAVKYHDTPVDLRFYFQQRRKNWAGRFQVAAAREKNLQTTGFRLSFFLRQFLRRPMKKKLLMVPLGLIELAAMMTAFRDRVAGDWPTVWYRG